MKTIVSYDVATTDLTGPARLRKVAKACKSYGVRVQYSVFECSLTEKEWLILRKKLLDIIDVTLDSVRVYFLGDDDAKKTEHHGVRKPLDPDGPLIV
jgi:CRISPR-associated protein Cas2